MTKHNPFWIMLQRTERGRVYRNFCCGILQLEFGNIMLRFETDGFRRFIDFFDELNYSLYLSHRCVRRKLAVELHPTTVILTLNRKEVAEMRQLLHGARSVIDLTDTRCRPSYLDN